MRLKKVIKKIPFVRVIYEYIKRTTRNKVKGALPIWFEEDFKKFKRLSDLRGNRFMLDWNNNMPIINQQKGSSEIDRHYIYHTAWAARCLSNLKPLIHTDISSSLYFAGITSAFLKIEFYDYRPANILLDNLNCGKADLTKLPFKDNSISSLSCMHVIEHIGLGRYGDEIDSEGDLKAISELQRVLASGGNLFFVVPIGSSPKIIFNAHRIYTKNQILEYFNEFTLKEFALIPEFSEDGGIVFNPSQKLIEKQNYGCGCFWFIK